MIRGVVSEQFPVAYWFTPAMAGSFSKVLSSFFTIHLEQISTKKQAGLPVEYFRFRFDGFAHTMSREVIFSAFFWTANETIYSKLKSRLDSKVQATTLSAVVAGAIAGLASYPSDALRTWRMNYPEQFKGKSSLQVVKNMIRETGAGFLFTGCL